MKYKFYFLILVVVLIDQITKFFLKTFKDYNICAINPTTNTGMVFGLFRGYNLLFIILSLIILVLLFIYYYKHKEIYLGLGFIVGGLIGNLIDRGLFGYVRDFIDFKIWPVFNLADSFIVIGIIIILIFTLKKQ